MAGLDTFRSFAQGMVSKLMNPRRWLPTPAIGGRLAFATLLFGVVTSVAPTGSLAQAPAAPAAPVQQAAPSDQATAAPGPRGDKGTKAGAKKKERKAKARKKAAKSANAPAAN